MPGSQLLFSYPDSGIFVNRTLRLIIPGYLGHQVPAYDLELAVQRSLWLQSALQSDLNQIRDYVESVTYDARNESVQAKFIPP